MAVLLLALSLTSASPLSSASAADSDVALAPILGVRTTASGAADACSVGPASGTNCLVTIVITGTGLPTADPSTIGTQVSGNAAIVTVEDANNGNNGWRAGRETNFFSA